jgi:hypothetical protein
VDRIKMNIVQIGWGGVGWTGVAQDRDRCEALLNVVMKLQVP